VRKAGFPDLYIANIEAVWRDHGAAAHLPLDAGVEFAPDWKCLETLFERIRRRIRRQFPLFPINSIWPLWSNSKVSSYSTLRRAMQRKPKADYLRYRCVTPAWDNSPRRKDNATLLIGSTPAHYEQWLTETIQDFVPRSKEENFIFINAWNEWAEGSHLEPCQKWGRQYLEATRRALQHRPAVALPSPRSVELVPPS
jgi:hypothetical protein